MDPDEKGLADLVAESAGVEVPQEQQSQEPEAQPTEETPTQNAAEETTPSEPVQEDQQEPSQQTQEPKPIDWSQFVNQAEEEIQPPQPAEDGTVDPEEYSRYIVNKAKQEIRAEEAGRNMVTQQAEQAEQIVPEMKTNPAIAEMVQAAAYQQLVTGGSLNLTEAAQSVRNVLDSVKAEANSNAQASVEVQKNAQIQSGSSQPAPEVSGADLAKRINANDPDAFIELIDEWQKQGIV